MSRLTPAQAHAMRMQAQQEAQKETAGTAHMEARKWLAFQRVLLKGMQSNTAREAHKAEVLPEIAPYIAGVLEANTGQPDDVFAMLMVWAIDAGSWPLAMEMADYAVRHALPMPDDFKRNAATLVADLCADAVLAGSVAGDLAANVLQHVTEITESADMPDHSRAKVHKAIAYGMAGKTTKAGQPGDWTQLNLAASNLALKHLTLAEDFHESIGVKADIKAVKRHIAGLEGQPDPEPEAPQEPEPVPQEPAPSTAKAKATRTKAKA